MARKLRIEYPGALYHVYSRGNYRDHVFRDAGARKAFLVCLEEACKRSRWVLHAYVLMGNHYHLALETPRGNLVEGMQWLQATFANRFNRFRSESGHVFQGRYHAKVLENEAALAAVAHYIHLNPVEAGLVGVERLEDYRDSSFAGLLDPKLRSGCLEVSVFLRHAGELADTKRGRECYRAYLAFVAADEEEKKRLEFDHACQGWAMGSEAWKRALVKEHKDRLDGEAGGEAESREARDLMWLALLEQGLKRLKRGPEDVKRDRKSAAWKVALAAQLRSLGHVKNGWLAKHLNMGAPAGVSRYLSEYAAGQRSEAAKHHAQIANIKV
ncbi:transposase IS200 like protein [mine drainage metagenome]|uniref:Transposase IS200 like protein n=1 Tax=mine drainage metagenome TaxID=410659 RepID=A0A1J5QXT7_9ZZZZ